MKIRKAAVAGMFYPNNKEEIESMINNFLKNIPSIKIENELKALIVPHAGYIHSGPIAAYAYSLLKKFKDKKLKIILIGPAHNVYINDMAADINDYWETLLGKVKVLKNNFPKSEEAHVKEHCLEVQLPFLQKTLKNFGILPLVSGPIDPKKISKQISALLDDNSILVISSDLSHFYDYKSAIKIDKNTIDAIENLNYNKMFNEGDACGKIPILALIDIAQKLKWKCKLLDYKNSGDTAGNKASVVGYASFAFY